MARETPPDPAPNQKLPSVDTSDITCRQCDAHFELRSDLDSDSEPIGKHTERTDYWCPHCGKYQGTRIDYYGPEPVQIGPNTYELH